MNIILVFALYAIFVGKVDSQDKYSRESISTQKVLLRKLQNLEQNEANTVTWNEILANVLVTKTNKNENRNSDKDNVLNKCFSQLLWMYKTYFYDRFVERDKTTQSSTESEFKPEGEDEPEINETTSAANPTGNKNSDPKLDVELIEPAYHGKIEEATDIKRDTNDIKEESKKSTECPEGTQKDAEGNCKDAKTSKFILHIPNQCPIGYKKDWLGYCRETF